MCKCEDMAIWHMHLGGHSEVAHAGAKLPYIIAIDVSSQSVVGPWWALKGEGCVHQQEGS
jgi:hypothetical protein